MVSPHDWVCGKSYCGSCAFWTGERITTAFQEHAIVETARTLGACMNRSSSTFQRKLMASTLVCSRYERWAALR